MHLPERILAGQATADHTLKVVAAHAHTFREMQAAAGIAVKAAVVHAHPVRDAALQVQEAADQTTRAARHAVAPAAEAMSTPEERSKIGRVVLLVADLTQVSTPFFYFLFY